MYIPPYHQQYDTDEHKDRGQSQDPHHRSGGYQPLVEVLVNPCPFHVSSSVIIRSQIESMKNHNDVFFTMCNHSGELRNGLQEKHCGTNDSGGIVPTVIQNSTEWVAYSLHVRISSVFTLFNENIPQGSRLNILLPVRLNSLPHQKTLASLFSRRFVYREDISSKRGIPLYSLRRYLHMCST